jgi:hypothetical protein
MAINLANNSSLANITALPSSISGGAMTLISEQTASSSATISFTSGIDSTYDSYVFKFINIHPATDETQFAFQVDTGTNTNYNQTITSTYFRSLHSEDDTTTALEYKGEQDQAQGTSFQKICINVGNQNDESCAGTLHLYNPSSSVFVKHFIATTNTYRGEDLCETGFLAGYVNTTTALTRFQFKMSSGNIDSGVIKLYGIS